MVDLHIHSTCSDGTFTPIQLVDYAIEKKLSAFALTDHDTVTGIDAALNYAKALRQKHAFRSPKESDAEFLSMGACEGIPAFSFAGGTEKEKNETIPANQEGQIPEIIPGVELSTEYQDKEIHVVGLYIDYKNADFVKYLSDFVEEREGRNRQMCELLQTKAGIPVSYEELKKEFPDCVITRAHFAKYLQSHGYIRNRKEAFERYIGDSRPCFVKRSLIQTVDAVKLILATKGIPILAHPILYGMSDARLEEFVSLLKDAGLIGIEALYSTYLPADERQIRSLAQKYHLKISGGSDFHGANKPDIDLACGRGNLYIDDSVWKELKSCAEFTVL